MINMYETISPLLDEDLTLDETYLLAYKLPYASKDGTLHITRNEYYNVSNIGWGIYYAVSVVTVGMFALVLYWVPELKIRLCYKEASGEDAQYVAVYHEKNFDLCAIKKQAGYRMYVYRFQKFIYDVKTKEFKIVGTINKLTIAELQSKIAYGLNREKASYLTNIYGTNDIIVEVPTILKLFMLEVLTPFNVFQIYSIVLWCNENYFVFAVCIFIVAMISICMTLYTTYTNTVNISKMARIHGTVKLLSDGKITTVSANSLTVGDIICIEEDLVTCDCVLLSGSVVVDESMLTGESLPVVKIHVSFNANLPPSYEVSFNDSKSYLYAATRVLQVKSVGGKPILGVVCSTGYSTAKGSLIKSILFPSPSLFHFETQSWKFIGALSVLAGIGFIVSLYKMISDDLDVTDAIIKACDLITVVVPPSLPLAMSVGVNFALDCLKEQKICCISPSRINMAGKIKLVCFDKTGTLTSDGMEVLGVVCCVDGVIGNLKRSLEALLSDAVTKTSSTFQLLKAMVACNSLTHIDEKLIGDPLEVKMFQFTSASIYESDTLRGKNVLAEVSWPGKFEHLSKATRTIPDTPPRRIRDSEDSYDFDEFNEINPVIVINSSNQSKNMFREKAEQMKFKVSVRYRFEFSSGLQRMGVLLEESGILSLFVKGSPEKMAELCNKSSIPVNYFENLRELTHQGYRVLAVASRTFSCDYATLSAKLGEEYSIDTFQTYCEVDMNFIGFMVLENKLKEETRPTLHKLHVAGIRTVMVTGDNPLTAIKVAKDCHLVSKSSHVFLSKLSDSNSEYPCEFQHSDDPNWKLDPVTLRPLSPPSGCIFGLNLESPHYELALTGDCYEALYKLHFNGTEKTSIVADSYYFTVLLASQIFARMTPNQKTDLVTSFQSTGIYVAMCGDGANDCGALKAAHVGVSLAESEASIAAPFTSLIPNIECIPILLSEGRASLITCFQLFRFMAMYSFIQFGGTMILYFAETNFGDYDFLAQDLLVVFSLILFMGNTRANKKLSTKRPSGNLLSYKNLISVFIHIVLCFAFQMVVYYMSYNQPGYVDFVDAGQDPGTWQSTSVYYLVLYQYIFMALLFAIGTPWKKSIITNIPFCICVVCVLTFSILTTLLSVRSFFLYRDDVDMPFKWRLTLLLFGLLSGATNALVELVLFPLGVRIYNNMVQRKESTVFGKLKLISEGGKVFHEIRSNFEKHWMI